jgi:biotin--protein ligase
MNILVYEGKGVSAFCLQHTLRTLRNLLGNSYSVQCVDAKALNNDPWEENTAALVITGGRDVLYYEALHPKANERIRSFVEKGGRYIGFCAGAYYAGKKVEFELGTPIQVEAERDLCFFPGIVRGGVYPGFVYDNESGVRAIRMVLDDQIAKDASLNSRIAIYYNGGGHFVDATSPVQVLARYPEGQAGIILNKIGQGQALLVGLHPEIDPQLMDEQQYPPQVVQQLRQSDSDRLALMRYLLKRIDLKVTETESAPPSLTPLCFAAADEALGRSVSERLMALAGAEGAWTDDTNRFALRTAANAIQSVDGVWDIVLPNSEVLPKLGPFSLDTYFKHWRALHPDPQRPGAFGSLILYGETVTSTQTILEKNSKLRSQLPDGIVCTATRQIAGRGRGQNVWISPPGCLPFSLLLHHPLNNPLASPVLFQYLATMAVVDAIRSRPGYEDLPIHLKWPNDIYARHNDTEKGGKKLSKIGGLLVGSSFQSNMFELIAGCGVNVDNPTPSLSLNLVIQEYNAEHGTNLAPISLEELLAMSLARLDSFYQKFCQQGFQPFLDLYYRYWIHTNQLITLKDQGGIRARILGITADYGLLEVVAVDDNNQELVPRQLYQLQPDGNSFDLMHNMISRKQ